MPHKLGRLMLSNRIIARPGSAIQVQVVTTVTHSCVQDPYFQTEADGPHIEHAGLWAIAAFGLLSLLVTVALCTYVLWTGFLSPKVKRDKTTPNTFPHFFRTHLGLYLLSLFACNFLHGVGYSMQLKWAITHAILPSAFCVRYILLILLDQCDAEDVTGRSRGLP